MFQRFVSAALVAAMAFACPAAGQAPADAEFSAERFRAHVTYLADDRLEGRKTGTRGHELAADYVAGEFARMGLKPAGDGGGWRHSVPLVDIGLASDAPTLVIDGPDGRTVLTHRREALIAGATAEGRTSIAAPMVFVGYGVRDEEAGIDDYRGLDVRGKIVVMLIGVREIDGPEAPKDYESAFEAAKDLGAVAMIMIPGRRLDRAVPWSKVASSSDDEPTTAWRKPDGTPHMTGAPPVKGIIALDHRAAGPLFAGAEQSLGTVLDGQAKGQRPKGFVLKARAEIVQTMAHRRYESPNVIGLIEGSDPKLKTEYVVLMGHADHLGMKSSGEGDRIYNGALDNAGGIATVLEVARALNSGPERPRRSILVIATTGEEEGLLGADFFAHYPTVPKGSIVAVVNIDMPILTYDFQDVVAYGADHSTIDRVVAKAAGDMGIKVSPDPEPEEKIFLRSDHYAMVQAGIPSVMLKLGVEGGGKAAWKTYFDSRYHKVGDDLSQPIDWNAGVKLARLNHRIVLDLANAEGRPLWYEDDEIGEEFAPDAVKAKR
ncbi:MAG TPA: M20/M25/M40 family metallo-hydrolase [Caulobacter sp.]|nr:M20/M25/M40 family metallo-hydrolase [Caulobacter sp.]